MVFTPALANGTSSSPSAVPSVAPAAVRSAAREGAAATARYASKAGSDMASAVTYLRNGARREDVHAVRLLGVLVMLVHTTMHRTSAAWNGVLLPSTWHPCSFRKQGCRLPPGASLLGSGT